MSEQSNNGAGGSPPSNNNNPQNPPRRNNNNRRRHNNNRPREGAAAGAPQGNPQAGGQPRPPQHNNQNPNQQRPANPNQQKRRPPQHNNNRPRPQGPAQHQNPQGGGGPFNIERIYEKYLNLLDQHIIARRKYHDLFFRADPPQKNKLERNFYNTLNDVREFENKLAPDVRVLFEKRNNGYQADRTYTSNHELPIEGDEVPKDLPPAEPHLLQSQIAADYANDDEESVGNAEDYLKYKNF